MSPLFIPASILGTLGSIFTSAAGAPFRLAASIGLAAVSTFTVDGAEAMLHEVVTVISAVTTPSLSVSWFSGSYWRMSELSMLLTVPFLFAAAVQAVVRTDMGVLVRAAFFDLPIAAISVTLAAPLITLLLAATDEMCTLVTGSGPQGGDFLDLAATDLSRARGGFVLMVIAVVILLAGLVLTVELIMRSAAIYIVVLFLPLGFAAMVWPARRVWIKRMLELLIALILSKFAMVAILSLAVAGLTSVSTGGASLTTALSAMALLILAAFSPWALLRLLPFTELAAGAGAMLHDESRAGIRQGLGIAPGAADVAAGLTIDPMMAGINGLRSFVSGGAASSSNGRRQDSSPTSLIGGRTGGLPPGGDGPPDFATGGDGSGGDDSGGGGGGGDDSRGGGGQPSSGGPAGSTNIAPVSSGEFPDFADQSPLPSSGARSAAGPSSAEGPPSAAPDGMEAVLGSAGGGPAVTRDAPVLGPSPGAGRANGALEATPLPREPVGSVEAQHPALVRGDDSKLVDLADTGNGFVIHGDAAITPTRDDAHDEGQEQ